MLTSVVEQRAALRPPARGSASDQIRHGAQRGDVAHRLMRVARDRRAAGRPASRRRSPSSPRCTGCRSARSAAPTGSRRTSARSAARRGAPCRRPSTPCPARRCRTRRIDRDSFFANATRPQSLIRSASSTIEIAVALALRARAPARRRRSRLSVSRGSRRGLRVRVSVAQRRRGRARRTARSPRSSSSARPAMYCCFARRAGVIEVQLVRRQRAGPSMKETPCPSRCRR